MLKKLALVAMMSSAVVSTSAFAQATNWGDVAGGTDPNASSETVEASDQTSAWGGQPAESETVAAATPEAAAAEPACGEDDPRYAQLVPVLKSIKAGESVEPLQTSFSTYVGLNAKIRSILGDNIVISSPDCSQQFIFDGVLTGKVSIPFAEQWNVINDALRTGDQGLLSFVAKNTKAAPASALDVISLAQFAPLDGGQLKKLYAITAPTKANQKEVKTPLMLELFLQMGGTVKPSDQGTLAYVVKGDPSIYANQFYGIHLEKDAGNFSHNINVKGKNVPNQVASLLAAAGLNSTVMTNYQIKKAFEEASQ